MAGISIKQDWLLLSTSCMYLEGWGGLTAGTFPAPSSCQSLRDLPMRLPHTLCIYRQVAFRQAGAECFAGVGWRDSDPRGSARMYVACNRYESVIVPPLSLLICFVAGPWLCESDMGAPPAEVLMSVPLQRVQTSDNEEPVHWWEVHRLEH